MIGRLFKWIGVFFLAVSVMVGGPIFYTEFACRGEPIEQSQPAVIETPQDWRAEARTYMVYPEWHIVYAYEGYAEAVKQGEPHDFPYVQAVVGFWSSLCSLMPKADELGEAGFDSKATIYTIGASFTLEMAFKALYEETIGRGFSFIDHLSPQDQIEAEMAKNYATFLQQVPWYKYDFDSWIIKLWRAEPTNLRSWERRLALGAEWKAKAAYARVIAQAVSAVGQDELTMKVAVTDINEAWLASQPKTTVLSSDPLIAETPRYRVFTNLARQLAQQSGNFVEIAGNDDILLSYIGQTAPRLTETAQLLSNSARPGFTDRRYLIATKVPDLTNLIRTLGRQSGKLEHIYDY